MRGTDPSTNELWGGVMYLPRTIVEVSALNDEDSFEAEGTFYAPIDDDA